MTTANRRAPIRRAARAATPATANTAKATPAPARARNRVAANSDALIADMVKAYSDADLAAMEVEAVAADKRKVANELLKGIEAEFTKLANGKPKIAQYAGMDLIIKDKYGRKSVEYPKDLLMDMFREMTSSEEEAIEMAYRLAEYSAKSLKSEIPENRLKTIEKVEAAKHEGLVFGITRRKI